MKTPIMQMGVSFEGIVMASAQIRSSMLGDLEIWRISAQGQELWVTDQGAQILRYGRSDERPVIWLSEQAGFRCGHSARGGIPVCWPWFGALERNPLAVQQHYQALDAPAHGLVRSLPWTLVEAVSDVDEARLTFAFDSREQPLQGWSGQARVMLHITLGEQLQIHLSNHNLGEQPLTISQALHSYFAVSDIRQVRVEGLEGTGYVDALRDWQVFEQPGTVTFEGETDRLYLQTPRQMSIVDPLWQRRIDLQVAGSASAVVWNPWVAKSRRLSDFAEDAWQRMLCIETANVLEDCLLLAPGETHQLALAIRETGLQV